MAYPCNPLCWPARHPLKKIVFCCSQALNMPLKHNVRGAPPCPPRSELSASPHNNRENRSMSHLILMLPHCGHTAAHTPSFSPALLLIPLLAVVPLL